MKFSAASAQLARNKRILALNLKDERAAKIIHKLISTYDIVIEQFRPGVMKKLKLDFQSLAAVKPKDFVYNLDVEVRLFIMQWSRYLKGGINYDYSSQ